MTGPMRSLPLVLLLLPAAVAAQERRVVVRVTDALSRRPIPNAEVVDRDRGTRRLTGAEGMAVLATDAPTLRLRVRQIGYQFVEREVERRGDTAADTVDVPLTRVAATLPATVARAASSCATDRDSASRGLSLQALALLRQAAGQYERFVEAYPFRVELLRRTAVIDSAGTAPARVMERRERVDARRWGDAYRPGEVFRRHGEWSEASILFVSALADSVFWAHHCLVARRVETLAGDRVLPLEFLPSADVRDPDWMGTAWLDSTTGQLRRVEFELTGLDLSRRPRRMAGYITFAFPSPFVARPDSILAFWWHRAPPESGAWGTPDLVQLLRVMRVEYRGEKPPAEPPPTSSPSPGSSPDSGSTRSPGSSTRSGSR